MVARDLQQWKLLEKVVGGWTLSGVWNAHSGFPWTPVFNVQVPVAGTGNLCSLVVPNSGYCTVRPDRFTGGASHNFTNSQFEQKTGNFPGGPALYFVPPTLTQTGIPPVPSVHRNSFRGPRYSDVDFTLAKSFGVPNTRVFGENAGLQLRADFYNLFNQVNFAPLGNQRVANITVPATGPATVDSYNSTFGQATTGLAGRVIELQARFSF